LSTWKKAWQQLAFYKWAFLGIILGAIVVAILHQFGIRAAMEDGIFWGAAAGLVVTYIPYFLRSGKMVTKRDNKALNLVAGVFVFLAISGVIIALFYAVFWLISLFMR